MPPGSQNIPGVSAHGVPRRRGPINAPRSFKTSRVRTNPYNTEQSGVVAFGSSEPKSTGKWAGAAATPSTLAFSGSVTRTALIPVLAALTFLGAVVRGPLKILLGSLSFVGALPRFTIGILTASLGFAGFLAKQAARALPGAGSFLGSLFKQTQIPLAGSLPSSAVIHKVVAVPIAGALNFTTGLIRALIHTLVGILGFNGGYPSIADYPSLGNYPQETALTKRTARAVTGVLNLTTLFVGQAHVVMSALLSFAGAQTKHIRQLPASTLSFATALPKLTQRALGGITSFIGLLTTRQFTTILQPLHAFLTFEVFAAHYTILPIKAFHATLRFAGTTRRGVAHILVGAVSLTGSTWKRLGRVLAGALGFVGSTRLGRGVRLVASLASSGQLAWRRPFQGVQLLASLASSGRLARQTRQQFQAALASAGTVLRMTRALLGAELSFTGLIVRMGSRRLAASLPSSGATRRLTLKIFRPALVLGGQVSRVIRVTHSAALPLAGIMVRRTRRALIATVSFAGAVTRQTLRGLSAGLTFAGFTVRRIAHTLQASLRPSAAFIAARIVKLLASLPFSGAISRRAGKALHAVLGLAGILAYAYRRFVNFFVVLRTSLTNLVARSEAVTLDEEGPQDISSPSAIQVSDQVYGIVERLPEPSLAVSQATMGVRVVERHWTVSGGADCTVKGEGEELDLYEAGEDALTIYGLGRSLTILGADDSLTLASGAHTRALTLTEQ